MDWPLPDLTHQEIAVTNVSTSHHTATKDYVVSCFSSQISISPKNSPIHTISLPCSSLPRELRILGCCQQYQHCHVCSRESPDGSTIFPVDTPPNQLFYSKILYLFVFLDVYICLYTSYIPISLVLVSP